MGNLPGYITKQGIYELFGLNSTSYLRDICSIDFPINNKTVKFKHIAHITDELIKLDGIAYHDNELRTRKRTNNNTSNESRRVSIVVNKHPENEHLYGRKS